MGFAALLIVVLAACGARGDRGPAWPKMAEREADGGESIAPRTASVFDYKKTEEPAAKKEADKPEAEKPADKPADPDVKDDEKPAAQGAMTTAPEEVIVIDDIVIEIEDEE